MALVALMALAACASAFPYMDVDAIIHGHGDTKMTCDGKTVMILNLGMFTPKDFGGLHIETRETRDGFVFGHDVTGPLPYTRVLNGNPSWVAVDGTDEWQPGFMPFRMDVPLTEKVPSGVTLYLTNNVGVYAKCVVT